jgi:uncharacterized integral membrane protein
MAMKKLKRISVLVLALSLLVFVFLNLEDTSIELFFWQPTIPMALLIFVVALIGFLIGIFAALKIGKGQQPTTDKTQTPTPT